ncbi:hypothetical protein CC78DRAFT_64238 [Lojkania enalia]|uniref:Uncharacterized protein n=1 Tax=Lojkania enalia TaxID=147567 RepID=A0A9P4KGC9_9PLEO|nr:hypothetical protein CC78DRAFT_64238 [Didymosphaeria enalia]
MACSVISPPRSPFQAVSALVCGARAHYSSHLQPFCRSVPAVTKICLEWRALRVPCCCRTQLGRLRRPFPDMVLKQAKTFILRGTTYVRHKSNVCDLLEDAWASGCRRGIARFVMTGLAPTCTYLREVNASSWPTSPSSGSRCRLHDVGVFSSSLELRCSSLARGDANDVLGWRKDRIGAAAGGWACRSSLLKSRIVSWRPASY